MKIINFFLINVKLCFIEVWSNKTRSFLTSFGIFLGIASLLINVAFIRAMDENIRENLESIGGLSILTVKKKDVVNNDDLINFSHSSKLNIKDTELIKKNLPYVKSILPIVVMPWGPVTGNGKKTYAIIQAISPDHHRVYNILVAKGRTISNDDFIKKRNVCIVGKRIVKDLFKNDPNVIGKQIVMNRVKFTIIGIIDTQEEYDQKSRTVLFPYSVYRYRFGGQSGNIEEIAIELNSSDFVEQGTLEVYNIFKQLHRGINNVDVKSNISKIKEMRAASNGITLLLIFIAAISLCVGAISIMNIMFAAIGDRIREIGIRKALGATPNDIFMQFIIEATILCFFGGIPGMFLGGSVTLLPKGMFPFNPALLSSDYLLAVGFTVLSGFLSGIAPALIAAKMVPTEALRY